MLKGAKHATDFSGHVNASWIRTNLGLNNFAVPNYLEIEVIRAKWVVLIDLVKTLSNSYSNFV